LRLKFHNDLLTFRSASSHCQGFLGQGQLQGSIPRCTTQFESECYRLPQWNPLPVTRLGGFLPSTCDDSA